MNKYSIIMPVHKFEKDYVENALKSVEAMRYGDGQIRLMIVGPMDVCGQVKECVSGKLEPVVDYVFNEVSNFVSQVNCGVKQCKTPYFSILEYDDVYMPYAIEMMDEYIAAHEDVSILLSINELYDTDGKFVCFANELPWDVAFIGQDSEIGYIGDSEMDGMNDYNCTGGFFKTEDFIALGGLKKSMKAVMWFEFLKRCAVNGKKVYVVPRVCYGHTINREGSYMVTEGRNIPTEELEFIIGNVKDECKSVEDTNKVYEKKD